MTHFELTRSESAEGAVRRLLRGSVGSAKAQLRIGPRGAHEARKRIRQASTCLALAHEGTPQRQRAALADLLREAAHRLAPIRDADALGERLSELLSDPPGGLTRADVLAARIAVSERRRASRRGAAENLAAACGALTAASTEIPRLSFHGGWKRLLAGHERSLVRAREAWRRARADGADEDLHEWRKRLKDLRHQAEALSPAMPEVLGGWAEAWHEAGDALGEHRDLALLIEASRGAGGTDSLIAALTCERRKLAKLALARGTRLHLEDPADQASRTLAWLEAWRKDG